MQAIGSIDIQFIAGFGPIVRDTTQSRKLYSDTLGIPFKEESGEYLHTEALKGAKTFALWPLNQAAQSCFCKDTWPDNVPIPQAWLEFDVEHVDKATLALESCGYQILVKAKKEPWGQTVSRFISPRGCWSGSPTRRRFDNDSSSWRGGAKAFSIYAENNAGIGRNELLTLIHLKGWRAVAVNAALSQRRYIVAMSGFQDYARAQIRAFSGLCRGGIANGQPSTGS